MRFHSKLWLVFIFVLVLMGHVSQVLGQGTFKLTPEPYGEKDWFEGWGNPYCEPLDEIPESLKNTNRILTEDASYYLVDLCGIELIAAIEHDPLTLIVDTDMDKDLSDETPVDLIDPDDPSKGFGIVTLKRNGVDVKPAFFADGEPPSLIVKPGEVYKSRVTLGSKTYTMLIGDITFDGSPDDLMGSDKPSDISAMDYNDDGEYDLWDEIRSLSPLTVDGGVVYKVSVAPDGSSITFEPTTLKMGSIRATTQGAILSLYSDSGAFRVGLRGDSALLPIGKYDVYTIQILAWDDQDRRFRMQCIELPEKLQSFEIREGETTTIEIGPPMKTRPVPVRKGSELVINVEVWGAYGERYFPYVRADDGGLVGWAGMKVIDEEGNELSSGRFEYG